MPGANSRYTPPKSEQERLVAIADGVYVQKDVLNIVEKIQAYDPNLKVKYLDPDGPAAGMFDAPYLVVEECPDGIDRVVCQVWTLDETVYETIVGADTYRHAKQIDMLKIIDEQNRKVKAEEARKQKQKNEAIQEMVADVLRSPKDTYTAINPVTEKRHTFHSTPQGD